MTKSFWEPHRKKEAKRDVEEFKHELEGLEKKLGSVGLTPWKCYNCGNVNAKNGFYCEKCRSRNMATYG